MSITQQVLVPTSVSPSLSTCNRGYDVITEPRRHQSQEVRSWKIMQYHCFPYHNAEMREINLARGGVGWDEVSKFFWNGVVRLNPMLN